MSKADREKAKKSELVDHAVDEGMTEADRKKAKETHDDRANDDDNETHHHRRHHCSHGGMMSSRKEKIFTAGCAVVVLVAAAVLIGVGSFLPKWAAVKNTTAEGNVSFSLWAREECFGIVCTSDHTVVKWTHEDCWEDKVTRQQQCKESTGYRMRVDTHCRVANFCNSTWVGNGDFENVPSLLFVAKVFQTPAMCSAVVSIVLYLVKICLLIKRPQLKRLHLKAAYLTFGAIAGFAAVVGVVIFCTMLDKDRFNQGWAPYLNVAGGGIFVLFGVGGYLSWRNRSPDEFDDDRSEYEKEFSDVKGSRPFLEDKQTSRIGVKASEV